MMLPELNTLHERATRRRAILERAKIIRARLKIGPTNNPYSAMIEANDAQGVHRWCCVISAEENHSTIEKHLKADLEGDIFVDSENHKPVAIRIGSEVFLVGGVKDA